MRRVERAVATEPYPLSGDEAGGSTARAFGVARTLGPSRPVYRFSQNLVSAGAARWPLMANLPGQAMRA